MSLGESEKLFAPTTDTKQQANAARAKPPALDFSRTVSSQLSPDGRRAPQLPRGYGNQAMLRLMQRSRPAVQTKLTINQPGDAYEQEADRVADLVMRMTDADIALSRAPLGISRKCAACEEEDKKKLQMKSAGRGELASAEAPPIVHEVLREPGQPLDAATRAFFEPRFGYDFAGVRVHVGVAANKSAEAIKAQAYTFDRHLVFADGQYSSATRNGRHLVAHELVHLMQQAGNGGANQVAQKKVRRRPQTQVNGAATASEFQVYACTKDLETSPVGRHAFFRVGGEGPGNPTYELEPQDNRTLKSADGARFHTGCWQGVPMRDAPEDKSANADCIPTTITTPCLQEKFSSYPIGKYCTFGPNSNSFVNYVAKQCGMLVLTPAGWTPGYDTSPPTPGTFAPSPATTLQGCAEESGCLVLANSSDDGTAARDSANEQLATA